MSFLAHISETRKGELIIFAETFFWSFFPIITLLSFGQMNPLGAAAWSTLGATIFFFTWLIFSRKWHELKNLRAYKAILLTTLFLGIGFYALYFSGLRFTTAGDAAIIGQAEVWSSFLFFGLILRRERYTSAALIGAGLMFVGVIILLFRETLTFNFGNFLILLAYLLAPFGNYFQQEARRQVSAVTLLFVRSLLSTPFLLGLTILFAELPARADLEAMWPLLLVNGALLLGFSKILWVEGIHRLPVAKAAAINMFGPALTLFFAYWFLREMPTMRQLLGLIPIFVGGVLILKNDFLHVPKNSEL